MQSRGETYGLNEAHFTLDDRGERAIIPDGCNQKTKESCPPSQVGKDERDEEDNELNDSNLAAGLAVLVEKVRLGLFVVVHVLCRLDPKPEWPKILQDREFLPY